MSGAAEIDGRPVGVFSQDFSVLGGSMGEARGRKILKTMDRAVRLDCPVISINESGLASASMGVVSLAYYRRTRRIRPTRERCGYPCQKEPRPVRPGVVVPIAQLTRYRRCSGLSSRFRPGAEWDHPTRRQIAVRLCRGHRSAHRHRPTRGVRRCLCRHGFGASRCRRHAAVDLTCEGEVPVWLLSVEPLLGAYQNRV